MLNLFFLGSLIAPFPGVDPSLASLASAPCGRPEIQRAEGDIFTRSIEFSSEFELIEMSAQQDGEEIPAEMMPSMTRVSSETLDVEFRDRVAKVEDGQPVELIRTYDTAARRSTFDLQVDDAEMGMDPISETDDQMSEIEGDSVRVVRDEGDAAAWSVLPGEDSALEEEVVAALRADYGLAFLLPEEGVVEGDSWELDASYLQLFLDPVGEMPMGEEEDGGSMASGPFGEAPDPELEGKIVVTHAGQREVAGESLEVFRLAFDCTTEIAVEPDMTLIEAEGGDEEAMTPSQLEIEVSEVIDGEGEVLFHSRLRVAQSVTAELSIERTKTERMSFHVPEMGEVSIEQTEVESGAIEVAILSSLQAASEER